MASSHFLLPLNGTWVADTPAGSDVCWRRELSADTAAKTINGLTGCKN